MTSVGSQTVVYEDRVTALSDVTVLNEWGVPIGIENDGITGGTRLISSRDGQMICDWQKPRQPVRLSGSWVNVDSRLGVVTLAGAGIAYSQASEYSQGISVYSDVLYGSCSDRTRQLKMGEEVAHRIVVLFVEATAEETFALTKSCRIEENPGDRKLHLKQPSGEDIEIPLLRDGESE
jgi:hypothetical protein